MRKWRPRKVPLITQLMNCKSERGIQLWTLFTTQLCLPWFNLYLDCVCLPGADRACGSVRENSVFTKWLSSSMPRGRLHHKRKTDFIDKWKPWDLLYFSFPLNTLCLTINNCLNLLTVACIIEDGVLPKKKKKKDYQENVIVSPLKFLLRSQPPKQFPV